MTRKGISQNAKDAINTADSCNCLNRWAGIMPDRRKLAVALGVKGNVLGRLSDIIVC